MFSPDTESELDSWEWGNSLPLVLELLLSVLEFVDLVMALVMLVLALLQLVWEWEQLWE